MRAGLAEAQADADPLRQFERWFEDALRAKLPLPNAMTLATVTPAGAPSARIVLLKGVERGGFVFYTNYLSRKGRELEQRTRRPACCSCGRDLERQVRIDGTVEKVTAAESDAYYATPPARRAPLRLGLGAERNGRRPAGARRPRWQDARASTATTRRARRTGAAIASMPQEIEFWQGRADRLHDRLRYRRSRASTAGRLSASLPEPVLRFLRDAPALARRAPVQALSRRRVLRHLEGRAAAVCVKRALPRLRVAQLWEAPVERNRYERAVAEDRRRRRARRRAARARRDDAPACSPCSTSTCPVWKERLRAGRRRSRPSPRRSAPPSPRSTPPPPAAPRSPRASPPTRSSTPSASSPTWSRPAMAHPDLRRNSRRWSERTAQTKLCLVHGDVSPKNILVGAAGPVFLDAECAWYGDPAFDLAFCLNHLLLKCLWVPAARCGFLECFDRSVDGLPAGVDWELPAASKSAPPRLLPALAARARRRQVAGRIPDGCAETAVRANRARADTSRNVAPADPTTHGKDPRRKGPAGLGLARPADGRGRGDRRPRHHAARASGRAIAPAGASTGAGEAKASTRAGGAQHPDRASATACARSASRDQAKIDAAPDRARRHRRQEPPRRQRHRRGVARLRARGRGGRESAAVEEARRGTPRRAAGAADPDLRRRRARARARATCRTS